jgi:signal transduction histidine kinase
MSHTILLIASQAAAEPVAEMLRCELDFAVEIAASRRAGLSALRRAGYALVVLDESLATSRPEIVDLIYQNALGAPVVELPLALTTMTRILRQARAAMARAAHDREQARLVATAALQSELNASLTGLLLESQLALRNADPELAPKLRHLVELAGDLRNRLRA